MPITTAAATAAAATPIAMGTVGDDFLVFSCSDSVSEVFYPVVSAVSASETACSSAAFSSSAFAAAAS